MYDVNIYVFATAKLKITPLRILHAAAREGSGIIYNVLTRNLFYYVKSSFYCLIYVDYYGQTLIHKPEPRRYVII